eukprot:1919091-Pyramimonas_sp.AAC.1
MDTSKEPPELHGMQQGESSQPPAEKKQRIGEVEEIVVESQDDEPDGADAQSRLARTPTVWQPGHSPTQVAEDQPTQPLFANDYGGDQPDVAKNDGQGEQCEQEGPEAKKQKTNAGDASEMTKHYFRDVVE